MQPFTVEIIQYNNKKVGNPTTWPMLDMLIFPKFGWRGAPMVVDIGGVRKGVSELLQAVYTKPLYICCSFASILNLNFTFPNLGERGAL